MINKPLLCKFGRKKESEEICTCVATKTSRLPKYLQLQCSCDTIVACGTARRVINRRYISTGNIPVSPRNPLLLGLDLRGLISSLVEFSLLKIGIKSAMKKQI